MLDMSCEAAALPRHGWHQSVDKLLWEVVCREVCRVVCKVKYRVICRTK